MKVRNGPLAQTGFICSGAAFICDINLKQTVGFEVVFIMFTVFSVCLKKYYQPAQTQKRKEIMVYNNMEDKLVCLSGYKI